MSRFRAFALAVSVLAPLLLSASGAQKRKPNPPEIEVVEFMARRTPERTVEIDGRIRNGSARPLRKLIMKFRVLAPDNAIVTTQRGEIESEILEPGEEAEFHWQMREPARAVYVVIEAEDIRSPELRVDKPGPHPIE